MATGKTKAFDELELLQIDKFNFKIYENESEQIEEFIGGRMNQEIKNLIEKATERRIEKIFEFHWQTIFGKEKE